MIMKYSVLLICVANILKSNEYEAQTQRSPRSYLYRSQSGYRANEFCKMKDHRLEFSLICESALDVEAPTP